MSENATTVSFTVYVDISVTPAKFSYTDAQGNPSDGSVNVSLANTQIVYTLDTSGLTYTTPVITGDTGNNISYEISANSQGVNDKVLTISDTDADIEDVCLKLVVMDASGTSYTSPDPQIKNE